MMARFVIAFVLVFVSVIEKARRAIRNEIKIRIKRGRMSCLLAVFGLAADLQAATVTVQTNRLGSTPSLLAYNSGHFVPGSNTRDWWRYSGVSGARVFITPSQIEPSDDIPGWGDGVTDQTSVLNRE